MKMFRQICKTILRLDSRMVSGKLASRCGFCSEAEDQHIVPEENKRKNYSESTVNMVTLLGRVGSDPVVVGNEQDDSYAIRFSLATDTGAGRPTWHTILVRNKLTRNFAQEYIRSGDRVFVQGRLSYFHVKENSLITRILSNDLHLIQRSQKNIKERQQHQDDTGKS